MSQTQTTLKGSIRFDFSNREEAKQEGRREEMVEGRNNKEERWKGNQR